MANVIDFVSARVRAEQALADFASDVPAGPDNPERTHRFVTAIDGVLRLRACGDTLSPAGRKMQGALLDMVLEEIAGIWADHPDYDPAWSASCPSPDNPVLLTSHKEAS
ncbi:MAG: hypothetical protein M3N43_07805 [Actinomycetota bacterium]|nr:hypothetical protein [Actinomycetota bacterium]